MSVQHNTRPHKGVECKSSQLTISCASHEGSPNASLPLGLCNGAESQLLHRDCEGCVRCRLETVSTLSFRACLCSDSSPPSPSTPLHPFLPPGLLRSHLRPSASSEHSQSPRTVPAMYTCLMAITLVALQLQVCIASPVPAAALEARCSHPDSENCNGGNGVRPAVPAFSYPNAVRRNGIYLGMFPSESTNTAWKRRKDASLTRFLT